MANSPRKPLPHKDLHQKHSLYENKDYTRIIMNNNKDNKESLKEEKEERNISYPPSSIGMRTRRLLMSWFMEKRNLLIWSVNIEKR